GERLDVLDHVKRVLNPELAKTIVHEFTHAAWYKEGLNSQHPKPINYATDPFYAYGDATKEVLEWLFREELSSVPLN
ncbi:MAG: hypothetical protein ABIH82_04195, partial [Candidatus Woesearchaeota archaeon]